MEWITVFMFIGGIAIGYLLADLYNKPKLKVTITKIMFSNELRVRVYNKGVKIAQQTYDKADFARQLY